ncbi:MAG TPA: hypothetical protein VFE13_02530 [Caulobacteraceae bacterium]|jgi:hypothetical protein|nr:hypothetical protein [Caulobacteraceae bacterium]
MPDGPALSLTAIVAAGLIALALVWPQGNGARSPAPFGHHLAPLPPKIEKLLKKAPLLLRGPEPAAKPFPAQPHVKP